MNTTSFLGALGLAFCACSPTFGATLDDIRERGLLRCGVSADLPGFSIKGGNDEWAGFDIDYCRAVAAATLGDAKAVEFVSLDRDTRFEALTSGAVDLLSGDTTWRYAHDAALDVDFVGVNYFDGQGFLVPRGHGITSAKELEDATICVLARGGAEAKLAEYFRTHNISHTPLVLANTADAQRAYLAGECLVYTNDASRLAAARATFEVPGDHILLPEVISKEPLGPAVRQDDSAWADIARWTLNALITAEELGITSTNVAELAASSELTGVRLFLGVDGDQGAALGLSSDWVRNVILSVGNYGEIFERNIGQTTPIGIARGLNAQWKDGGLLYAAPFR